METVIAQGTVEMRVPTTFDVCGVERVGHSGVRIELDGRVELVDVVVRVGDRTVTIKRLLLRGLHGVMLPVVEGGRAVMFESAGVASPNPIEVVG